jgi:hypothetical protein
MGDGMKLSTPAATVEFTPVAIRFNEGLATNVFARKNNKTVAETLAHRCYMHLSSVVQMKYPHALNQKLGTFLYSLKLSSDLFYLRFLNKYGDETYCVFTIQSPSLSRQRGVYAFVVNGAVKYIGQSVDSFGRRINQGYGVIHPKNCYLDGQATNCHLNALIAQHRDSVSFYAYPLIDIMAIGTLERQLIQAMQPEWNIALKTSRA